jgi:very-short-patch-repair endonuclease
MMPSEREARAMRQRVDPHIRRFAKELRGNATECERLVWSRLRQLRTEGFHFRRQAPFRSYILDFVEHRHRLVIELDGSQHGDGAQHRRDLVRDRLLEAEGYRVLRVWNGDVFVNLDGLGDLIMHYVAKPPDVPGG